MLHFNFKLHFSARRTSLEFSEKKRNIRILIIEKNFHSLSSRLLVVGKIFYEAYERRIWQALNL